MMYINTVAIDVPVILVAKNEASIIIVGLKFLYDMKRSSVPHIIKPVTTHSYSNITTIQRSCDAAKRSCDIIYTSTIIVNHHYLLNICKISLP